MKIVLLMAVSLDGFIAKVDYSTDWVKDMDDWEHELNDTGCVILGRKTHDEVGIIEGVKSFVLTSGKIDGPVKYAKTPLQLLQLVEEAGFTSVILGGGGETNAAFARDMLIDEVILSIHPLLLGKGIHLFGSWEGNLDLKFLETKPLHDGVVQNRYTVVKN